MYTIQAFLPYIERSHLPFQQKLLANMIALIFIKNTNKLIQRTILKAKSKMEPLALKLNQNSGQIQNSGEMQYDESSLKRINQGAFGTIYKAKRLNGALNQFVAVKQLPLNIDRSGFPTSIMKEIGLLKHLNHPNIINLIGYNFKERYVNLVFDYFHYSLSQRIAEDTSITSNILRIKQILRQILLGIEHMHKKGVIHRDIKTENIMIDQNRVLIIDLGSGRRMQTLNPPYTENMGTQWYRAPQMLLGVKRYDEKVDLWSVGCVLAEMFVKRVFFEGYNETNQINIIFQTLGKPNEQSWPEAYRNTQMGALLSNIQNQQNKLAYKIRNNTMIEDCEDLQKGIDLLEKLLTCNPKDRISASQALQHPFLQ